MLTGSCHLEHDCRPGLPLPRAWPQARIMFVVDADTAAAIRRAWEEGGELAGVAALRRHFRSTGAGRAKECHKIDKPQIYD
jgi:hypothetical protein